ncbi:PfkB family carbohydrate kinase [Streptomyces tremellae]|uniref:Carbohydrate kinase n=1 Tax=Streptomyces tremellae TaxID=1124239 RepID=A0ABP7FST8_9ACTN
MTGSPPRPQRAPAVLGIGEVLWDLLPSGRRLGGAPFNVTAQLARMGFTAGYLTAVGDDEPGLAACERMRELGVGTALVRTVALPTGRAEVTLDAAGEPRFDVLSPAAHDRLAAGDVAAAVLAAGAADVLVYGTLASQEPATCELVGRLAAAAPQHALRVYDVNLREGRWAPGLVHRLAAHANVLKLSESELIALLGLPDGRERPLDDAAVESGLRTLADRYGLRAAACSMGGRGGALLLDGAFARAASAPVAVADTVGAGDAFTAALAEGLHRTLPAARALRRANALGGLTASRTGALPDWTRAEWEALTDST